MKDISQNSEQKFEERESWDSLLRLEKYSHLNNYKGWDPYDGLNSVIFKSLPLNKWSFARLAWIQFFKRSFVNFRNLTLVKKGINPKGLALFLSGYTKLYSITKDVIYIDRIRSIANLLIEHQTKGYSGVCWGYNFDWQARGGLYFPSGTPNVVTTSFCTSALFDAYEVTKEQQYLDAALSSANFVERDLNRSYKKYGFLFSYSPVFGNNTVYNASLMGSKLLIKCYQHSKIEQHLELSYKSVISCVKAQREDGSWIYGELPSQNWIDSFHTGYNLECLQAYQDISGDTQFNDNIENGFKYYIENFFLSNGVPKYFNDKVFPIDIHCPGQLFVTLSKLRKFKEYNSLATKVMDWTIKNMQNNNGYFYYQKHRFYTIKIPYMRWSQAFMFYGMCHYLWELNQLIHKKPLTIR